MKPLLCALTLVAGLAAACGGEGADDDASTAGSVGSLGATGSVRVPALGPDAPGGAAVTDSSVTRLVVTSRLSLEVTDLRDSYRQTGEIARGYGGFVADGRITSSNDDGAESNAFLRVRVPYEQHDALLDSLRSVGSRVTSEETASTEVTGEYTDLQSRIANLQRSEAQYQDFLVRAGTIEEVLDVAARLDEVRGDIEQLQGRINLLADQSDFATVSVTLSVPAIARADDERRSGHPSPATVFVNTLEGSLTVAHALVNVSAVMLVLVLWVVPVGAAVLLLRRPVLRLIEASRARLS